MWTLLQKAPIVIQKEKKNPFNEVIQDCFQAGVINCQILNLLVESQIFTFSKMDEIELIQTTAVFSFIFLE